MAVMVEQITSQFESMVLNPKEPCKYALKGSVVGVANQAAFKKSEKRLNDSRLRQAVAHRLADDLDAASASEERVATWRRMEEEALDRCSEASALHPAVRWTAIAFAQEAVLEFCQQYMPNHWLRAVQLFDLISSPTDASVERVLVQVLAATRLVLKADCGERLPGRPQAVLGRLANRATEMSIAAGGCEVLPEQVLQEETRILRKHGSKLCLPSVATWISLMLDRFDIATNRAFHTQVDVARAGSWNWAETMLQRVSINAEYTPYILAVGVCCAMLLIEGLVPEATLVPASVDLPAQMTFRHICTLVHGSVPPAKQQIAITALEFACSSDSDGLRSMMSVALRIFALQCGSFSSSSEVTPKSSNVIVERI